jgi:CMP-N-acetylneuraminic acid synthetase
MTIPIENQPNVICIIPARGGSKGLKLKNLQKVNNQPLLYYPIKSALKSEVCDHIFVSTDNLAISKIAKKLGANVPFLRKKIFSGDRVSTEDTLRDALLSYEKYVGIKFDICVFLTCTNIFRDFMYIKKAVDLLKKKPKIDSAFVVTKIYKHFWCKKKKKLSKALPWMNNYHSRQHAPELYLENTGIACATRAKFWRRGKRIGKKVFLIKNKFPFSEVDIHSKNDLFLANKIAELIYKNKKLKKRFV